MVFSSSCPARLGLCLCVCVFFFFLRAAVLSLKQTVPMQEVKKKGGREARIIDALQRHRVKAFIVIMDSQTPAEKEKEKSS